MYIFYVTYVFSLVFDLLEIMYYLIIICYYNFFSPIPMRRHILECLVYA